MTHSATTALTYIKYPANRNGADDVLYLRVDADSHPSLAAAVRHRVVELRPKFIRSHVVRCRLL